MSKPMNDAAKSFRLGMSICSGCVALAGIAIVRFGAAVESVMKRFPKIGKDNL